MKSTSPARGKLIDLPSQVNYVERGSGRPVVCIHGLAASLHDWDFLLPDLAAAGYHGYALDLLGHGDSPKIESRTYKTKWLLKHLEAWIESLQLAGPIFLVGHSLGGYLALRYAMRHPERVRALVLVNPFFRLDQLPWILRRTYRRPTLNALVVERTPEFFFHWMINFTNAILDHNGSSDMTLPEPVRTQTALDYKRTHPGAFNLPNTVRDLTLSLSLVPHPTLLLWGDRDQTLAASSFPSLLRALPNARGHSIPGGHVPHQSNPAEFNRLALEFFKDKG